MPGAEDMRELVVIEEVTLEKYEGVPKEGDIPIEVVRVKRDGTVERELHPPRVDASLAVNAQLMGDS